MKHGTTYATGRQRQRAWRSDYPAAGAGPAHHAARQRWLREPSVSCRRCSGWVLLLAWQLAAMNSKGFPTPLSTLDSALTLFADPFYQDGPNDMGIGWNVLASLQRVAVGFGLAALAGIPLGFLIGRSLFFARMFNPLIALLRPVSPLAWLPIGLLLFQKAEPASSWTIFICSIWPMVINTAEACGAFRRTTSTWPACCSFRSGR
jgi:ABC-type nitrate/sulfonate/bicarbonate transport system permease component